MKKLGGHLCAHLLNVNFERDYNVSSKCIKGFIPVSGIFDLTPLIKTDVNDNLKMDYDEALSFSPQFRTETFINKDVKILIAFGEKDSPLVISFENKDILLFLRMCDGLANFPNVREC